MTSPLSKLKEQFKTIYDKAEFNSELKALMPFLFYEKVKEKFWGDISRYPEADESYYSAFGKIVPVDWDYVVKNKRLSARFREQFALELLTRKSYIESDLRPDTISGDEYALKQVAISETSLLEQVDETGWKIACEDMNIPNYLIDKYKSNIFLTKKIINARFKNLDEYAIADAIFKKKKEEIGLSLKLNGLLDSDILSIKNYNLLIYSMIIPRTLSSNIICQLVERFKSNNIFNPIRYQDIKQFKEILDNFDEPTQRRLLESYSEFQNFCWELCVLYLQCLKHKTFSLPKEPESLMDLYSFIVKFIRTEDFEDFNLNMNSRFLFLKRFDGAKHGNLTFKIPQTALELCLWGDEIKEEFTPLLEHIKEGDFIIIGLLDGNKVKMIIELNRKAKLKKILYSEESIKVNSSAWRALDDTILQLFQSKKLKGYI